MVHVVMIFFGVVEGHTKMSTKPETIDVFVFFKQMIYYSIMKMNK